MSHVPLPTFKRTYTTVRVQYVVACVGLAGLALVIVASVFKLKIPLWGELALLAAIGIGFWRALGSNWFFSPTISPQDKFNLYVAFSTGESVPLNAREAQRWLQGAAAAGWPVACTELALQYLADPTQNDRFLKALPWLNRAAVQDEARALFELGELHRQGLGCEANEAIALGFLRRAAGEGEPYYQNRLGYVLAEGLGLTRDLGEAAAWFEKAARQHNETGQENFAEMFYRGLGVPQSDVEALKWYLLAKSHGEGLSDESRGHLDELMARMSPDQISRAERDAREWLAANVSHDGAMLAAGSGTASA